MDGSAPRQSRQICLQSHIHILIFIVRTHSPLSYQVPFLRRLAQVSRSASQRSARRPGMKQYSPPRLTTKAGSPLRWRWIGRFGMVNSRPSLLLTSGSFSAGAPMNLPSFTHSFWMNSNCRSRCAPTKANMRPRSAPSSSRTPGAAAGHSWCRA